MAFWWIQRRSRLPGACQKRVQTSRTERENERMSGQASNARASDRKLSISKSIWPGLPIGCRLISRWIVSNMGILLMARRGIGCTSDRRGLQPRSRALPKSIARGLPVCSRIRYSGLNALWCCCNGSGCTAVSHIRLTSTSNACMGCFEDDEYRPSREIAGTKPILLRWLYIFFPAYLFVERSSAMIIFTFVRFFCDFFTTLGTSGVFF